MSGDTSKRSVFILGSGESVLTDIELIEWIDHFGRRNVQELIAKRKGVWDVIAYLRAERSLELARGVAFVTSDLVNFEKGAAPELSLRGLNYVQEVD